MTRLITDAQAQYAYEHSQLVSSKEMRAKLTAEWQMYIKHVRAEAWEAGWGIGWKASATFPHSAADNYPGVNLYDNPHRIEEGA